MSQAGTRYVPAAGRAALTMLYDPVMRATMRERAWRPRLQALAEEALPERGLALDVGAGTGTFAISLAAARPDALVVALDGDPRALSLARGKPGSELVDWREGMAAELPFEDGSADVVVMSLLLHHLEPAPKVAALDEAARVLRPRGRLLIADWGRPGALARPGFALLRVLDGRAGTAVHAAGRLPRLVEKSGFAGVERRARLTTGWGNLELLEATRR